MTAEKQLIVKYFTISDISNMGKFVEASEFVFSICVVFYVDVQHRCDFSFLLQLHQGDVIQSDDMCNSP